MITTRGRYAIRVLLDIAENYDGKYIPLKDIAARQNISKKYLEIIVKDLVSAKLLFGTSGRGGGYKLCRKPEEYCLGEIIELMDGPLVSVSCLMTGTEPCPRASECETLPLWTEFDQLTHDFFYSKYLSDLIRER
ncbi:MAG: Rrf2 family transcriptional regulator [Lachnospiraceae bacterium]|nr:Rrf2 family transcriptional regulator [Lachnospiraceae bacterium]MDN4745417.1 Rrf2 family transcriptional regulator [Lachnospiraceae bacterium C1.1]